MNFVHKILLIETYNLTAGTEEDFLKTWKAENYRIASGFGGRVISLYHKKETNSYMVTSHWTDAHLVQKYLKSEEHKRANSLLKKFCSLPHESQLFEILSEDAA